MPGASGGKNITSAAQLGADTVGESEIQTDAVRADEIQADAVGVSEIATDGVDSAEIKASAVGTSEIANESILTEDIKDGEIVNADISASAGIVDTKLAQIATAGKVSGAALTSLANIPAGAGVIPNANLSAYGLLATGQISAAANATFVTTFASDLFTAVAHGLEDGMGVVLTTTGTLPSGVGAGVQYFVRDKTTDTFKLSATPWGAVMALSNDGTGVHTWTKKLGEITVSFAAKNYLKIVVEILGSSGALTSRILFNADGGANYGKASSLDGAASAVDNSQLGFQCPVITNGTNKEKFAIIEVLNFAANRKLGTYLAYEPGDGSAGGRSVHGGLVWNNTADQITSVTIYSEQPHGFGTASRVYVLGND